MTTGCAVHRIHNCPNETCRRLAREAEAATSQDAQDNAGKVGIDNQLDPTIGLGNGLGVDLTDGSLTIGGNGFSIDTDGQ